MRATALDLPAHVTSCIEDHAPWDATTDGFDDGFEHLDPEIEDALQASMLAAYEAELTPHQRAVIRYEAELHAIAAIAAR